MSAPTRWHLERSAADSHAYVERFRELERSGADLHGEARMVDAAVARGSRILDAGCGTGRLAAELARRGHRVTGVDLDPVLVAEARTRAGIDVVLGDLLTVPVDPASFDAVVAAGNVLVFLAPGTEATVLRRWYDALRPGGRMIAGFATDRAYSPDDAQRDLAAVGFVAVQRFSTWSLDPWRPESDWIVLDARRPGGDVAEGDADVRTESERPRVAADPPPRP
ncbi:MULTISPECIES: class I SAM-dependent methyltransferase [Nocardiaceae]|uniref:Class I SAM-dependent methyltransferase n=1 Tax=Rhodococcoides kroppenstedtii TaxID=293050 RepID=A0ABS7NQJ9_9NOCA|nr:MULTISPECIES: class I SAM-dependent methyltransferase [Rhodococcus]AMY19720.1 Malonyl-[acyl-carrier protein] O-methyltransferase [Rhodococcus sp. PBTS 1]MBY6312166.1 class I SAM-dependent methyltransferase [Rhodococcus kroppenstedtii]MBY6319750.1 class I SAM-dependent methyltransferase [Rhodococcus kroppenstedtii]MBY6398433.1 class I SAM-dependent methyltransferase [Rhodococcus kroppenstedtii]